MHACIRLHVFRPACLPTPLPDRTLARMYGLPARQGGPPPCTLHSLCTQPGCPASLNPPAHPMPPPPPVPAAGPPYSHPPLPRPPAPRSMEDLSEPPPCPPPLLCSMEDLRNALGVVDLDGDGSINRRVGIARVYPPHVPHTCCPFTRDTPHSPLVRHSTMVEFTYPLLPTCIPHSLPPSPPMQAGCVCAVHTPRPHT